jgi:hypothetical protein
MSIFRWRKTYRNDIGGVLFVEGRRRIMRSRITNFCYYDGDRWYQADVDNIDTADELYQWLRGREARHRDLLR